MSKKIVAKVKCVGIADSYGNESVSFNAVIDGSEENKSFSAATPSLNLNMVISNPDAKGAFEAGKEYLLTFEPA